WSSFFVIAKARKNQIPTPFLTRESRHDSQKSSRNRKIFRLSGNAKRGLFTVQDFIYDAENDRYTCPAGEFLTKEKIRSDRRDDMDHYRNLTACLTRGLKSQCTPDKVKRQKRWEHEAVLDRMQARLDRMPEAMIIRRQTVEHPFGTLKAWMGSTHFLTRTLEKVKTEMSLQVLAYNIKRMINIFGVRPLMQAIAG
ncbi:MAG: transposase, partial [Methylocystis sp.]